MRDKLVYIVMVLLALYTEPLGGSTVLADDLPSSTYNIEVKLSVQSETIVTFEPLIARVTLTNLDVSPFELDVRMDGAPYAVTCLIAYGGGEYFKHDQWIRRSGPEHQSIVLAPGESTSADILIWTGPPKGFAFSEAGTYIVQFAFQHDSHHPRFARVLTNTVELTVVPDKLDNRRFLEELSELSYGYFGYDREIVRHNRGEEILIGYELIHKILKVQEPHLIDPEGDAYNRKETKLVETLSEMLERYPNTSYAGYIARYLGLVHAKTFEHEISHHGAGSWGETKASPEHNEITQLCQSEYEKAQRYLMVASKVDLWPRTTAAFHLARLYGLAEEWAKFSSVCDKLRTAYAEVDGVQRADELERQMVKYKAKLERRKAAAP